MLAAAYYHTPELPWTIPEEEQRRYRKILKRTFLVFLLFALILPFLPVPELPREEAEELPPRLAKLLLERQAPPPLPKVEKPEPTKTEPAPAPKKVEPKPTEPVKRTETARAKAERSGVLAFRNELADLRTNAVTSKLERNPELTGNPTPVASRPSPASRSLITSNAAAGSGGIDTARLSRDTGGGGLAGRATTQVASLVAKAGGGADVRRGGGGTRASRALEEIRLVFDRNKGSIYALYNRALREDPTLQGKVVLRLTIAPTGEVIDCQIVSSELRSPELERKLLARVKQFNFGKKDVEVMVVTYPIDFLPS